MLAAGSYDRFVSVWNPFSSVLLFQTREHMFSVVSVAFLSDDLICADESGVITIWNTGSFIRMQLIRSKASITSMVSCSEKDCRIILAGRSDQLMTLDQCGGSFHPLHNNIPQVTHAVYSASLLQFITAHDRMIRIWNALTGSMQSCLNNVTSASVTAMILDTIGRRLFLGDCNGQTTVLNLETCGVLFKLESHHIEISGSLTQAASQL
uniref:Uncharacterized protein n=1 Tax=Spongospora subterranea TaxID=70186 RepID=A0A0H5R986_9EUKA|eukprot:CRZ04969.1 hypothetical protein [Spongospora subterranea]